MRRRYLALVVALCALLLGSVAYTVVGLGVYARYRQANADFATSCAGTLAWSPPQQIYTGFYPNQPSLVTLRFRSASPALLRVSVSIPGFTQEQAITEEAGPTFQAQAFKPPILSATVLDALVGPRERAAQLHVSIQNMQRGGLTVCDTSASVTLLSRQWMRWSDPATGDNAPYLAGWVTPQASVITDLIGQVASRIAASPQDYDNLPALYGYDQGQASADAVRAQVDAIFDTLQFTYHLRYASDTILYGQDASQLIQLPKDVLSSPAPTGMCVETTVIMAAAVERLGMRPYIALVPGHAFLGVALGADPGAPLSFWETSDLNGGVDGAQANVHGNVEYNSYQQQGATPRLIDVVAERQRGINPIE